MSQPLLTIAIPTYNGSKTITNMLDLLLPQVDERVELLIVDNLSTDNTAEIIRDYKCKFPFIKYKCNESNIGADGNFLKCMRMAHGKYVYLLSDDDIMVEGALKRVLDFLDSSDDMGLIYLGTGNFYVKYKDIDQCVLPELMPKCDICTTDKKEFMNYAKYYWGFISSFIIRKDSFAKVNNPEQYFGTYWLQCYIYILCASGSDTKMGIVSGLNVAAGVYVSQSNLDTGYVDGVSYRHMLDFACQNGFNKEQLDKWFIKRLTLLASHAIVKEKATGNKKIDKRQLFSCTKKYPKAWFCIYPFFFIPSFICRAYMKIYRKNRGGSSQLVTNRIGDVSTNADNDVKGGNLN